MKSCWKIKADLSAYVDKELPATRRAEVEAHLGGCADCRQLTAELQRLADGIAALPRAAEPSGVLVEVRRRLQETPAPAARWGLPAWGGALAALMVAGGVAFWWNMRQPAPVAQSKSPPVSVAKLERARQVEILPEREKTKDNPTVTSGDKFRLADEGQVAADLVMPTPSAVSAPMPALTVAEAGPKKVVLPAPEVITVAGNDTRQVQEETQLILASLQGRVESVAATSFKVSLPASNVAQLKARLALREAGRKEVSVPGAVAATAKQGMARGSTSHKAVETKAVEMMMGARRDLKEEAGAVGGGVVSVVATQEMVVLEIRVQP